MKLAARSAIPLLLLLSLLIGCSRPSPDVSDVQTASATDTTAAAPVPEPKPSDETTTPAATEMPLALSDAASQMVPPAGGEIAIDDSDSPIHGLVIAIPEGSYAETTEFTVSHQSFDGELLEGVSALTPLIRVENGGEYANELMTVTVPIELPEDHFAMGFFVNEDGSLEGMPLVDLTSDSITVASMHFSDFLIAMIPNALLEVSVDTGFRPDTDSWHFPNYGSAIAPRGHCAGMSISAMWYYLERRKKGAPMLHGHFDNNSANATPDLWEDDSLAYRLASSVQRDIDWDNRLRESFNSLAKLSAPLTWRSFLFSMHATGEPQYVSVYSTDRRAGHALVAYAVDVEKGELLISDPNHSGQPRMIPYVEGKFLPYISARDLFDLISGRFVTYDVIRYNAKSALVPWPQVAARWSELEAGACGNDRFPEYRLIAVPVTDLDALLSDGIETSQESIAVDVLDNNGTFGVRVWHGDGWKAESPKEAIPLAPGENLLGCYIHRDVIDDGVKFNDEYVDFQWVRVERVSESYDLEVQAQVHAKIRRVNKPDPSVGYEGQTITHDTPFENARITAPVPGTRTGNVYSAQWTSHPSSDGEGTRSGYIYIQFGEGDESDSIVSFEAEDTLTTDDGSTRLSRVSGSTVPEGPAEDGTRRFELRGPEVLEIVGFVQSWSFASGDSREVISYRCDEHSLIRITIR